jgi:hypothetical protein
MFRTDSAIQQRDCAGFTPDFSFQRKIRTFLVFYYSAQKDVCQIIKQKNPCFLSLDFFIKNNKKRITLKSNAFFIQTPFFVFDISGHIPHFFPLTPRVCLLHEYRSHQLQ